MSTNPVVDLGQLAAIVPVHSPARAKTRLGLALDAEEREVLVLGMLAHTLAVLAAWPACRSVFVVSDDERLTAGLLRAAPAVRALLEPAGDGLNGALTAGRQAAMAAGASALLMLPADLPTLTAGALETIADAADAALAAGNGRPVVVLAPADAGRGTNAMLVAPPATIDPHFGEASLEAHLRAAAAVEASLQLVIDPVLGFDLDTPEDLERLDTGRQLELHKLGEQLLGQIGLPSAPASPAPAEAV